jgi:hypothetical protein
MEAMEQRKPALSDPARAAIAWARYRRMMRWVTVAAILAVIVALFYMRSGGGMMTVHVVIATTVGVGASVLLAGALMLLAFLSSGSGHDEDAAAPLEDER